MIPLLLACFTPFSKRVILGPILRQPTGQLKRAMTWNRAQNELPVGAIADTICRRGWRLPALVALEAGRPLAFVGGQLLWVAQPVLGLVLANEAVGHVASILEDPAAVAELIALLDGSD
jgi:hypothetical protein